ncbi:hypothetical protein K450DRAFT_261545 [Umbelopsis ramanniana AG]|uniref:Uncharacterized protein n=1 Tax=Umbelopsis ramanniana AG TaxID=1314678 RepID=A0AAD5HA62_UMBRA|nr:uncharacterized protein K450DRAFT_261545 [Umbelopsis ramanniana AG]KAI8575459.1 hypothetical protein K450DRAFT_261545 [Umbelopsis ramanniana AG]
MEQTDLKDKRDNETETLEVLQKTVQQIEHSFSTVYSTLSRNFQQSLSMVQGMTSTLEHVLKTSIKIGTKVDISKDEDACPIISITVFNASQFPMKSLSADIQFVPVQSDSDGTVTFNSVSSNHQSKNVSTSTKSLFDGDSELLPEERLLEIIAVRPSSLAQYNGHITVSILSPGTGQKLQAYHKFGLYIIDQLKKTIHLPDEHKSIPRVNKVINPQHRVEKLYELTFFRRIMGFSPAQGIAPGITIEFAHGSSNIKIECHMIALNDDSTKASCLFEYYGDGPSGTAMATLLSELDILESLERV